MDSSYKRMMISTKVENATGIAVTTALKNRIAFLSDNIETMNSESDVLTN